MIEIKMLPNGGGVLIPKVKNYFFANTQIEFWQEDSDGPMLIRQMFHLIGINPDDYGHDFVGSSDTEMWASYDGDYDKGGLWSIQEATKEELELVVQAVKEIKGLKLT